ncbi:MAG: response regulator [Lachnospiraceae bacterium]|nr:response regulator [Lachnospiraceae bacterium]
MGIAWKDSYKVGVDFIDKEHQQLFTRMNKLLEICESSEKNVWACREGVKYLRNHAMEHFEHEEEYMQSIQHSEYEIHKRLHDDFRDKTLPALEVEMEETGYSVESIRHFLGVCLGWVVAHTQTEDQVIAGKATSKWAELPPKEEKEALEAAITRVMQEMFHKRANLLSEHYAGEDFGKVVCCRFLYRGKQKEKWEVTLVYEERLLLKIIGNILDMEYSRVDDMVINVVRYLSRQFIEKIRKSFPMIALLDLEKESLLTHEQLLNSFEREQPTCSLLFQTNEGYFAFSVAAADTIRGAFATATVIDPNHVMTAVNDYLAKESRKKILLVDDSEFMRGRIVKLLSEDYDLVESDSSISAIREIAVNRPDLILLDYEMPVCDGRQALEMIRSDKDIADIPVIFLTAKDDLESVRKVMSLRPEGYLLKKMSDGDIKKNIDNFFGKSNK